MLTFNKIISFVKNRNLSTIYTGLSDEDANLNTLTSILITKIYYLLCNKDLMTSAKEEDYNFKRYQDKILPYIQHQLDNLSPNCIFIEHATTVLRNTLTNDGTNIRRKAIIQLINII